ncbi:MAG TPA: hypothetical protein VHK67_07410 [Rhabdochlamydiaceae bacterium]|jgi:predicted dienelactone hydrolase|nr:hypothetical protein [Rhabdochlamydiaceae bacterium]
MIKWIKPFVLCFFVFAPFTSCVNNKNVAIVLHPQKTGIATVRFYDASRDRPLITEVWYPVADHVSAENVNGLWLRCPEARDAPLKESGKKYPLVVMSHGNGGDRTNNAWLAEILAANGYIVASVDHHGNTWNNKIAENYIKIWERPQDVSYIVDQLLEHEDFAPHINSRKIGFIGYSLGGHTGIWIAGGEVEKFDKEMVALIPKVHLPESVNEELINSIDYSPAKKSYRDPRISAVFVMAPALGHIFDYNSLQKISIPVYIVASEGDNITPIAESANILAKKIKKAAFTLIPGNANHFVYLNEVTKGGKMMLHKDHAIDPPGIDRHRIHEEIGHSAVQFFNSHLK